MNFRNCDEDRHLHCTRGSTLARLGGGGHDEAIRIGFVGGNKRPDFLDNGVYRESCGTQPQPIQSRLGLAIVVAGFTWGDWDGWDGMVGWCKADLGGWEEGDMRFGGAPDICLQECVDEWRDSLLRMKTIFVHMWCFVLVCMKYAPTTHNVILLFYELVSQFFWPARRLHPRI